MDTIRDFLTITFHINTIFNDMYQTVSQENKYNLKSTRNVARNVVLEKQLYNIVAKMPRPSKRCVCFIDNQQAFDCVRHIDTIIRKA